MSEIDWIKFAIQVGLPVGGLIYGYARMTGHVERALERIEKLEKYSQIFFERIEGTESDMKVQKQINSSMSSQYDRIEKKLDSIETLLRSRRSTDEN